MNSTRMAATMKKRLKKIASPSWTNMPLQAVPVAQLPRFRTSNNASAAAAA